MNPIHNHAGYQRTFRENKLTLGLIHPLETYTGAIPRMDLEVQINLAKLADQHKFAALYVRDIPLHDKTFGDVGQMFDPWIFLSYLAAKTHHIALGTASAITSFDHPLQLAKAAASIDVISNNRFLCGLATGDRAVEFEVFRVERDNRAVLFREAVDVMKEVWRTSFPLAHTTRTHLRGDTNVLPKPALRNIPIIVTGFSGQTLEWISEYSDGWMSYPRPTVLQEKLIRDYRTLAKKFKPFSQSLHIDLAKDANEGPTYMRLGFRSGRKFLLEHLKELETIGVNHVILGFKDAKRPAADIIQELAEEIVPFFPALS